jgi:hypothetical protein
MLHVVVKQKGNVRKHAKDKERAWQNASRYMFQSLEILFSANVKNNVHLALLR